MLYYIINSTENIDKSLQNKNDIIPNTNLQFQNPTTMKIKL